MGETATEEKIIDQTAEKVGEDGKEKPAEKPEEGKSETGAEGEGGTGEDRQVSDKGEIKGYEDDPKYKAAVQAQESLQGLLEKHGYESVDDLKGDLSTGKSLLELFGGDKDAAEAAAEKARKLDQYEAYWAEEEEKQRRQQENPEDTIKRLEQKNKELEKKRQQEQESVQSQQKAEKLIQEFTKTVNSTLKSELKDLPDEYRPMIDMITGLKNPMLDIELEDKRATIATTKDVLKKFKEFEDAVIKRYLDGKKKTEETQTGGGSGGGESTSQPEEKVKNLKDARKALRAKLGL